MWTRFIVLLLISSASYAVENQWGLSTADTELELRVSVSGLEIVRIGTAGNEDNWIAQPMPIPFMGRAAANGEEHPTQWMFKSGEWNAAHDGLTITLKNEQPPLLLRSIWIGQSGPGPIEHRIEIVNQSNAPVTLFHQDSLTLRGLDARGEANAWWIKRGGSNASTEGGTCAMPLTPKLDVLLTSNCDDGASPCPWLAIQKEAGGGLYLGWEFSGLGRIHAAAAQPTPQFEVAVGNLPEFKTDIAPGEVFLVPPAFVGCFEGDLDEGAYRLHQWILNHVRPALPEDIADPTLAYNLYLDAGGDKATEADVLRSAAFCRDIGFETFMPDAMWFPACGDWRWDPARFPNGVKPIEAFVHGAGMKLALWCAWSNGGIAEDPGALSVRGPAGHPDWFDSDFPPDWKPGPFYGGRICLADAAAQAWAVKKTQWLVSNHGLDYLKHDCGPIITQCNKTTHRHKYGVDASYWATMGYYNVQEKLRQAFPRLILENCSGGGHIKDFGIIRRTHYTVTTDTLSNLPDRQSLYDSTYAFPPILLQAYTYERNYKVPGDDPCPFLWRSAMMGAWQIDPTNTQIWSEAERASAKRHAEIYKAWIRPMFKDVKVYHILPRPDGTRWDGMFYWSAELKRGTLYIFRPDSASEEMRLRLKGLDETRTYEISCEDGSVEMGPRTGEELMKSGLAINLPSRYSSDLVYVQDAELGKLEKP